MTAHPFRSVCPTPLWTLGLSLALAAGLPGSALAVWPSLPTTPIAIQAQPDPNIILTLDDSGSMAWAFVPDDPRLDPKNTSDINVGCPRYDPDTYNYNGNFNTCKRFTASKFNSLAYNPYTIYELPYNPDLSGSRLTTSFSDAYINGFFTARGSVNLSTSYKPVVQYNPAGTTQVFYKDNAPSSQAAFFYAFYNDLGPSNAVPAPGTDPSSYTRQTTPPPGCGGLTDINNDACYIKIVVSSSHQQNFANWYSFYKTRNLLTISSANIAFFDLNPGYRVSWQALNTCKSGFNSSSCSGYDGVNRTNYIRPLSDATHRGKFYAWLSRLPANSGTPLRAALDRAGQFYTQTGLNSPAAFQPGILQNPISTCRSNFTMVMTDGIWNNGSNSWSNIDGTGTTLGDDTTSYSPIAPFTDTNSSSLADIAFKYWAEDLIGTVANDMIPFYVTGSTDYWDPQNDPATWQHMVTFTVGLGLGKWLDGSTPADGSGYLPKWGTHMFDGDYPLIKGGTKNWPLVSESSKDRKAHVADLWHAAINSRGMFFNADSPQAIKTAFQKILNRIKATQTSLGQIGSSTSRVTGSTLSIDSKFVPGEWYSTITAYKVYEDGSRGAAVWSTDTTFTNDVGRNIFTSVNGNGVAFDSSFFSTHGGGRLGTTDVNIFNWLRGERSKEGALSGSIRLRKRTQLLGDIVGSDLVVSGRDDEGYQFLADIGSTNHSTARNAYATYVQNKKTMVFVGANDGMLHAFSASGSEVFAYIPNAIHSKLRQLADADYVHQYYVDGSIALHDVYLGGAWKTILVGGLGGGGRGWYALDVTEVIKGNAFSKDHILFDLAYDGSHSAKKELGYSFGTPVVGRTIKDHWVILLPNGYGDNSTPYTNNSCKAQLVVYNLTASTLNIYSSGAGSCSAGNYNGLSSPVGMEFGAGSMIGAYAGDLQGNLWRFRLNSSGDWTTPTLFFSAKDSAGVKQPITGTPSLRRHPGGGLMVVFGTGKFFESTDRSDKKVQTIYGLRDTGAAITSRGDLVQQTITSNKAMTEKYRTVSNTAVNWGAKQGWYLDLDSTLGGSASGERVVAAPAATTDIALFNTYAPGSNACTGAGGGYLMALSFYEGGLPPKVPLFDTNGDNKIDASDLISNQSAAGVKLDGQSLKSPGTTLVTTTSRGSPPPTSTPTCGGLGMAPCVSPDPPCVEGLIVKNGVCSNLDCPVGYIQVNSGGMPTCMRPDSIRYPRWIEIN